MTSFRWILTLPRTFNFIRANVINASNINPGAKNHFSRLILTHSRCLFTKKSVEDLETEDEIKRKPDLFQLNYLPKKKSINQVNKLSVGETYSSLSDLIKKIQDAPLNSRSVKTSLLFGMIKLYKLQRSSPGFLTSMDNFIKSEEFEKFAQNIVQSLPMESAKHLHLVFQAMHSYQIPCSSILMQKLHALILDNINKFELPEVLQMYLMIKDKNENLLEPLKKAFSAYMNHLTFDSLKVLGDLKRITYFVSKEEIPLSIRENIVKKVLSLRFQLKHVDPVVLTWLSLPLCSEEFQFFDKKHFLIALKETINNFEYKNLKIVLENLKNGIRKKLILYDVNLFNLIAQCASNYELQKASIIMNSLLKMNHVNYELANAIAEKFIKADKTSLKKVMVEEIISSFGWIDYKNYLMKKSPENWFELEKELKAYIESVENFESLKTYVSLFILELHSKELIGNALNDFCKVLESNKEVPRILLELGHLLYQCHCAVYSSPPENVSEKILSNYLSETKFLQSHAWQEAIHETFNGEEYVLEKCITPFGALISFAVILGPDQNPINLSSYKKPKCQGSDSLDDFIEIEKIERPPGSKVFAFIEYSREYTKFRNLPLFKPKARLITGIHKNLNYRIFHLYSTQEGINSGDCGRILSTILARELNYNTFKNSQSSTPEISNVV